MEKVIAEVDLFCLKSKTTDIGQRFILTYHAKSLTRSEISLDIGARAQAILDGWSRSRSQKLLDGGAGACNLGPQT